MIDRIDAELLNIIQRDAHISNAALAAHVGLTKTAVYERIRKMQTAGIIQGYETRLAPKRVACRQAAFIYVRADERPGTTRIGARLAKIPEVLEVHHIAGEDCYLIKVRVRDTETLSKLLRDKIGAIKAVRSTRTTIVFDSLKESSYLPVLAEKEAHRE